VECKRKKGKRKQLSQNGGGENHTVPETTQVPAEEQDDSISEKEGKKRLVKRAPTKVGVGTPKERKNWVPSKSVRCDPWDHSRPQRKTTGADDSFRTHWGRRNALC